jgi:hypothetical protein
MSQTYEQPWQVVADLHRDAVTYRAVCRLGEYDLGRGYAVETGARVVVEYRPGIPQLGGELKGLEVRPVSPSSLETYVRRTDGKQLTAGQRSNLWTFAGLTAAPLFSDSARAIARRDLRENLRQTHTDTVARSLTELGAALAKVYSAQ